MINTMHKIPNIDDHKIPNIDDINAQMLAIQSVRFYSQILTRNSGKIHVQRLVYVCLNKF